MFERGMLRLGYLMAKFQFRSDIDHVQPMGEFISRANNVLICLPIGYDEAALAGDALYASVQQLSGVHITVVHTSTRATQLTVFPRCEVIRLDPADINRFSLPTKALLQRIYAKEYDVAMDLNLDFVLHTAYICKASRAKVRVGYAHSAADLFYNVQLNFSRDSSPQVMYKKFASTLAMF
ncbi:MAG TPA: hypothetical protein VL633_03015 [Bacteroidota bacterium]|jgi:hypothetical protein|nr:hypothetical protein [Bacteroidota bacterium]